jgi:hypothetical protein
MSVLQDMTKGIAGTDIVARKAAKATKLTPVAGETATTVASVAAAIPDVPGGVFLAAEAVSDIERDLRAQAAVLIAVADGLAKYKPDYLQEPDAPAKPSKVEARLAGKDPEPEVKDFTADFAAKSAAAQAAAFTSLDDGAEDTVGEPHEGNPNTPEVSATGGWQCPTHGDEALTTLTSRKQRVYQACTLCDLYDKGL